MVDAIFEKLNPNLFYECFETDYAGMDWHVPAHWHHYLEVVFVLSGKLDMLLNGNYHTMGAGTIVFINSQVVHAFSGNKQGNPRVVVLKFDKEILLPPFRSREFLFLHLLMFNQVGDPESSRILTLEESIADELHSHMRKVLKEHEEQKLGYELAMRTGISQIFLFILRQGYPDLAEMAAHFKEEQSSMWELKRMADYITEHFREPLSVRKAAKACNMSYSYFSRQFKNVFGKSFVEFLNFIRVMEAEKILLSTNRTITDIALEVGFTNTSYFIRHFQLIRGMSPKKYKNMLMDKMTGEINTDPF